MPREKGKYSFQYSFGSGILRCSFKRGVVSYWIIYRIARLSKKTKDYNHAAIIRLVFIFIFMGYSLFFSRSLG